MKLFLIFFLQCIVLSVLSQVKQSAGLKQKFIDEESIRGVIVKKVVLFGDQQLDFDSTKQSEIPYLEYKLIKPEVKVIPTQIKDSASGMFFSMTDPITGEPLDYSKDRLKLFYRNWKEFFIKNHDVISHFDSTNYSVILFKEKISKTDVYVTLNVQFKDDKFQMTLINHGIVRTLKQPTQLIYSYGELFANEKINSIDQKLNLKNAFEIKMKRLTDDFIGFITSNGDFIQRCENDILNDQFPSFNF